MALAFLSPSAPSATLPAPAPRRQQAPRPVQFATWPLGPALVGTALAAALPRGRHGRAGRTALRAKLEKFVIRDAKYPDETPKEGDLVRIHYMGKLSDGTCFDNSRTREKPFEFILGDGEVIDGWEALIPTMAMEEKAELICPPEYAYGEEGVEGIIPPNETLTYRVELLDIGRPMDPEDEKEDVVDVGSATPEEEEEEANFWDKDEQRESGRGAAYSWEASGSGKEILIRVPLDDDVRVKQIKFSVTSTSLMCKIADKMILDGTLFASVLTDDSFWDFEKRDGKACLLITLGKMDTSIRWESVLQGGDMPTASDGVEVLAAEEAASAVAGAKKVT